MRSLLIANRGEIAVRIAATCRRLGIRTVAVYSDADAGARHVLAADTAVRLGAAPAAESYLSIEALLRAAAQTGVEAVHPGYGFLAENAGFARAVQDAGLVWVGPSPEAIDAMGDKIRAKALVQAAGVPVVPGVSGGDLSLAGRELGFPLLIKPSAGGGGKGMVVVRSADELDPGLESAARQAQASFGDATLLLERWIDRPRHIEVQVLADTHGTTLHLGERECSLQRRHQKVIEEAPSPLLTPEQRERYGALACEVARSVGYTGAGTVELIVGEDADEPFFMEMNTRLQVEHPVTELVTGLDLVELQLRVAAGEPLGLIQSDVRLTGHAVEARVYAEDPAREFLPTGGQALLLREPSGVRVDSSLLEGREVGTTYDPMLAKVITWSPDRAAALAALDRALAEHVLLGVTTNTAFLRALVTHPDVVAGDLDTGLIERSMDTLVDRVVPKEALVLFALLRIPGGAGPWESLTGWRPASPPAPLRWDVLAPDRVSLTAVVEGAAAAGGSAGVGAVDVTVSCEDWSVTASLDGDLLTVEGVASRSLSVVDGDTVWVHVDGRTWSVREAPPVRLKADAAAAGGDVRSPMPGAVLALRAEPGATVAEGDPLLVVEAMKMEHVLRAPVAGTLELLVRAGQQVVVDQVLARVAPPEPPASA